MTSASLEGKFVCGESNLRDSVRRYALRLGGKVYVLYINRITYYMPSAEMLHIGSCAMHAFL